MAKDLQRLSEPDIDKVVSRLLNEQPAFLRRFMGLVAERSGQALNFESLSAFSAKRRVEEIIPDIKVVFSAAGQQTWLLVENKVRHTLGNQHTRYLRSCGALRRQNIRALSVLLCPTKYAQSWAEKAEYFNACIHYEELLPWADDQGRAILEQGIMLCSTRRTQTPDEAVTRFHQDYREFCSDNFPNLIPNAERDSLKGSQAHTIYFDTTRGLRKPEGMPRIMFSHQWLDQKWGPAVKVMIQGLHELAPALNDKFSRRGVLEGESCIRPAEESLALALATPPLDPRHFFDQQVEQAIEGMLAAISLREQWNRIVEDIWAVACLRNR